MAMKTIACLSQKGGVGKSTLARLIARSYAISGWRVKIADFNTKQKTSVDWAATRMSGSIEPPVAAEPFTNVRQALGQNLSYDLMVFDGRPDSETIGRDLAKEADLVVVPVGVSIDDLMPQVKFAHELVANGVERKRIIFVVNLTVDSKIEIEDAHQFVQQAGFRTVPTDLPNKTGYRMAQNTGRAASETTFPTLNERADQVASEIADALVAADKVAA